MSFISSSNAGWSFFRGQASDPYSEPFQATKTRLDPCRFSANRPRARAKGTGSRINRYFDRWLDLSRWCRRCGLMFMLGADENEDLCQEHAEAESTERET